MNFSTNLHGRPQQWSSYFSPKIHDTFIIVHYNKIEDLVNTFVLQFVVVPVTDCASIVLFIKNICVLISNEFR